MKKVSDTEQNKIRVKVIVETHVPRGWVVKGSVTWPQPTAPTQAVRIVMPGIDNDLKYIAEPIAQCSRSSTGYLCYDCKYFPFLTGVCPRGNRGKVNRNTVVGDCNKFRDAHDVDPK